MAREEDLHDRLIAKFGRRVSLDEVDRAAVRNLPITLRHHERHARLVRQGAKPVTCGFIASGYAIRSKMTVTGSRQILALLQPGDLINLQQIVLSWSDHDVEALTEIDVGDIPADRLAAVVLGRPALGKAAWIDILVEGSICRESLLSTGRRNGAARVAHLFCELAYRLSPTTEPVRRFELPLTQEQLGDMTGLTGVHVNRVLKMLRERGLVTQSARNVIIDDWKRLVAVAGFSPGYLHLAAALSGSENSAGGTQDDVG